jgi:hypothetical protein
MTISLAHASGAQAVPAGEPCGRAGLAIVALRQRHRQSWGGRCPCPGLLTSCPLPGSPSLGHPLPCSLTSAQVRHAPRVTPPRQAGAAHTGGHVDWRAVRQRVRAEHCTVASARPSSVKIVMHPARCNAARCRAVFWSSVLTRAEHSACHHSATDLCNRQALECTGRHITGLTLCATSPGDVPRRLRA